MNSPKHIVVNWLLCDGNAACVAEAPDYFDIDDSDELKILSERVSLDDAAAVDRAVTACPKHALSLEG